MGDFHVMWVFKMAISGEIVNNLDFFDGFDHPWMHVVDFDPIWAALSFSASSAGPNLHVLLLLTSCSLLA